MKKAPVHGSKNCCFHPGHKNSIGITAMFFWGADEFYEISRPFERLQTHSRFHQHPDWLNDFIIWFLEYGTIRWAKTQIICKTLTVVGSHQRSMRCHIFCIG